MKYLIQKRINKLTLLLMLFLFTGIACDNKKEKEKEEDVEPGDGDQGPGDGDPTPIVTDEPTEQSINAVKQLLTDGIKLDKLTGKTEGEIEKLKETELKEIIAAAAARSKNEEFIKAFFENDKRDKKKVAPKENFDIKNLKELDESKITSIHALCTTRDGKEKNVINKDNIKLPNGKKYVLADLKNLTNQQIEAIKPATTETAKDKLIKFILDPTKKITVDGETPYKKPALEVLEIAGLEKIKNNGAEVTKIKALLADAKLKPLESDAKYLHATMMTQETNDLKTINKHLTLIKEIITKAYSTEAVGDLDTKTDPDLTIILEKGKKVKYLTDNKATTMDGTTKYKDTDLLKLDDAVLVLYRVRLDLILGLVDTKDFSDTKKTYKLADVVAFIETADKDDAKIEEHIKVFESVKNIKQQSTDIEGKYSGYEKKVLDKATAAKFVKHLQTQKVKTMVMGQIFTAIIERHQLIIDLKDVYSQALADNKYTDVELKKLVKGTDKDLSKIKEIMEIFNLIKEREALIKDTVDPAKKVIKSTGTATGTDPYTRTDGDLKVLMAGDKKSNLEAGIKLLKLMNERAKLILDIAKAGYEKATSTAWDAPALRTDYNKKNVPDAIKKEIINLKAIAFAKADFEFAKLLILAVDPSKNILDTATINKTAISDAGDDKAIRKKLIELIIAADKNIIKFTISDGKTMLNQLFQGAPELLTHNSTTTKEQAIKIFDALLALLKEVLEFDEIYETIIVKTGDDKPTSGAEAFKTYINMSETASPKESVLHKIAKIAEEDTNLKVIPFIVSLLKLDADRLSKNNAGETVIVVAAKKTIGKGLTIPPTGNTVVVKS